MDCWHVRESKQKRKKKLEHESNRVNNDSDTFKAIGNNRLIIIVQMNTFSEFQFEY